MSELANPYIAGAPVVESSMFFGREDVFKWIERSLAGKFVDHILVIHGQRRVGKTSVLKQIPNYLPHNYLQVFFDLQGRTSTTFDRFLWWLASEIARTIKKERGIEIPRPDRAAFEDPEYLIGEFLPSLKTFLGDQILILTFDEFDTLDKAEIQETLARPLIAYLRRMMELEGLNFIFSIGSSGDKLENMQASYTDFFKTALYRKISFLTQEDCHRLVTKPVEGTIGYDPQAVKRIFEITSGHPYFTQLMCHELFALCQKTGARVITADNVEAILGDVIERGTVNLKFVWDEASDLEKWILAGLAQMDGGGTNHKLAELLQNQRVRFSDSDLNAAVIHLRDKDILTESNRFVIHLMRMWLLANRPLDRVREELAEVNPIANRYIEIGDEYRDRGQAAQAVDSYRQALKADPANLRAQTSIGQIFFDSRDYPQAIAAFEQAIQMDDEDVSARSSYCAALLAQGDLELESGQIEAGLKSYEQILTANPAHRDACRRLARIYSQRAEEFLKAGQDESALSAFNKAIDYTPEDDSLVSRYDKVLANKKAQLTASLIEKAERAIGRQRWEEATGFMEEAIKLNPQDSELKAKLLKTKDAPRQFKIEAYKQEAEQALKRKNYPKAIESIETALQLSPNEPDLSAWLATLQAEQRNEHAAQIKEQLKRSLAAADWQAALAAVRQGKMLAPDAENWDGKLIEIQNAKHEYERKELREKADAALKSEEWDRAIDALLKLEEADPGQANLSEEIEQIKLKKHKAVQTALKISAGKFASAEKWNDAIKAWEEYLGSQPADLEQAAAELEKVKAQASLAADYQTALNHIRSKHFDRAISLLQGIIAKDPTYKSTSRLLVEAVEARKVSPPSRSLKFAGWAVAGILLLAGLGFGIYWIWNNFSVTKTVVAIPSSTTSPAASDVAEAETEPDSTAAPISNLEPYLQAGWNHIQTIDPQFQIEFDDWEMTSSAKDADITNGTMRLASDTEQGGFYRLPNYPTDSFAVEFMLGIPDSTVTEGACVYEAFTDAAQSESDRHAFSAEYYPSDESLVISAFDPQSGEHTPLKATYLDWDQFNKITLIVLDNQISVFINGEHAFTTQDPAENAVYWGNNFAAYNYVSCDFSSYKYWDLRDITNSTKTAIIESSNRAPYFETGFDSWDFETFPENVSLEEAQLVIRSADSVHSSTELRNLAAESLLVEFDLEIVGSDLGSDCGITVSNTADDADPFQRMTSIYFQTNGVGSVEFAKHTDMQPTAVQTAVDTFHFNPNQVNHISQIIVKERVTTFVNGELVSSFDDPNGGYLYLRQMLWAWAPDQVECRMDNYKIWDLSDSDYLNIRPALEAIRDVEPDYQTTFGDFGFNDLQGPVEVEAEKLIVTSEDLNYVNYLPSKIQTNKFAVSFDYKVRDSEPNGHCGFGVENGLEDSTFRSVGMAFYQDGSVNVGHFVYPDKYPELANQPGAADGAGTNRVTMIFADNISVLVNGILVITAPNPEAHTLFSRQNLLANYTATCEYDNYSFWDLSDIPESDIPTFEPLENSEFFNLALSSIEGKTPSFEEDFETQSLNWQNNLNSSGVEAGFYEGSYLISTVGDCNGVNIPGNDVFSDFILELDITFLNQSNGTFLASFRNNDPYHYGANFSSHGWVSFHKNIDGVHIPIIGSESLSPTFNWTKTKHFTLVVKQDRMAIFVDGQLVTAMRDATSSEGVINFGVCDGDPQKVLIDNLKIWDLTDG